MKIIKDIWNDTMYWDEGLEVWNLLIVTVLLVAIMFGGSTPFLAVWAFVDIFPMTYRAVVKVFAERKARKLNEEPERL